MVEAHIAHEHADRFGPSLWVAARRAGIAAQRDLPQVGLADLNR